VKEIKDKHENNKNPSIRSSLIKKENQQREVVKKEKKSIKNII
jgi:hypothetical protein